MLETNPYRPIMRSNALLSESTLKNFQAPVSTCQHSNCKCFFIPPHIQKVINGASREVRQEHLEIVADHNHDIHRQHRKVVALQGHHLEPHTIHGFHSMTPGEKAEALQEIYNADHKTDLPGIKVENPKTCGDISAVQAFEGGVLTAQFFSEKLNRNSINGLGMIIKSILHYDEGYNNAFWDGVRMIFGDGDKEIFGDFTGDIDVIGHELSHGVTQYTANLEYQNQSGALNEHISDVFGSCIKQYQRHQKSNQADWLIGDVVLLGPGALRSMKNPGTAYDTVLMGKDPQPASMDAFVHTKDDEGGVHINSGIPNKAFYLVCKELDGYSYEAPAKIWYDTITSKKLKPTSNFKQFAALTVKCAGKRFGENSAEQTAVRKAWMTVKVL